MFRPIFLQKGRESSEPNQAFWVESCLDVLVVCLRLLNRHAKKPAFVCFLGLAARRLPP